MKKIFIIIALFYVNILFANDIYQNYVQAYGEGPIGQYLIGFETMRYSKENAVEFAREEIMEFLSGMIYGYNFVYKVENKINNTKGYFDLIPIAKLKNTDKNISLSQFEKKDEALKIQALYRLSMDQKIYFQGYPPHGPRGGTDESADSNSNSWGNSLDVFKKAIKNAVFNEARRRYKSRPLFIKGKLLLKESPLISLVSGKWRVRVKAHVFIIDVKYRDVY